MQLSRINSVLPASLAVAVILGWVLAKEMGAEISKATPRNLRMSQLTPALYLFLLPPCCLDGDVVVILGRVNHRVGSCREHASPETSWYPAAVPALSCLPLDFYLREK